MHPARARDPIAAIEAALRRLPRSPQLSDADYNTHLNSALAAFRNIGEREGATPNRFRHVGQRAARRALEHVAARGEAMADAIDAMPAEAIAALANLPPGQNCLQPWAFAATLRAFATRVRSADISAVLLRAPTRERRNEARPIAANAALYFALLTGKVPTLSTRKTRGRVDGRRSIGVGGPFVTLLMTLFEAFGISSSVEATAKSVLADLRTARKNRPTDDEADEERMRESMEYIRTVEREQASRRQI